MAIQFSGAKYLSFLPYLKLDEITAVNTSLMLQGSQYEPPSERAYVSIQYLSTWGTAGFRAGPLPDLFLWLAHVCDWSLWWVGAGPVVFPKLESSGSLGLRSITGLWKQTFLFWTQWCGRGNQALALGVTSECFWQNEVGLRWLMLWSDRVRSLVGSRAVKSNETNACSSHLDQAVCFFKFLKCVQTGSAGRLPGIDITDSSGSCLQWKQMMTSACTISIAESFSSTSRASRPEKPWQPQNSVSTRILYTSDMKTRHLESVCSKCSNRSPNGMSHINLYVNTLSVYLVFGVHLYAPSCDLLRRLNYFIK